ncbi:hypothetical protein [Streptomyces sp. NPDC001903]|uniref:hypothetical protein n=1 Tax=Streptomyces sp. NPDC001903 TaxID=3364622 RepID=UPI0036AB8DF3
MRNRVGTTERRRTHDWSAIAPGAEVVGGVQLICAALYAQLAALADEPYGRGYGGAIAVLFWLVVQAVLGPCIGLALGFAHSLLFTTPVMVASNAVGVRTRIPAPWWAPPALGLLAAGYAVPVSWIAGTAYAATFGWIAALGVLPVGASVYARMRLVPKVRARRWALVLIAPALVIAFAFGVTAPAYQPPVLARADYVGEWAGDGVHLELGAQGEVTARELPVYEGFEVVDHCSGHGTWKPLEAAHGHRAGVDLAIPNCHSANLSWEVAGTDEHPELFVLMGDPDAGETVVLSKRRPG